MYIPHISRHIAYNRPTFMVSPGVLSIQASCFRAAPRFNLLLCLLTKLDEELDKLPDQLLTDLREYILV